MDSKKTDNRQKGFSLLELVIVVVIIGVIAAIAFIGIPAVLKAVKSSTQPTRLSKYMNAQANFRTAKGKRRYGTLQELRDAGLIDDTIAKFNPRTGAQVPIDNYLLVVGNENSEYLVNSFEVTLERQNRTSDDDKYPDYCIAGDDVIRRGRPTCGANSTPVDQ